MIERLKLFFVVFFSVIFISTPAWPQASPSKAALQARLTLLTEELREGDHFKVRIEIENTSDHPVLVARELHLVSNMLYRTEIRLEDSSGYKLLVSGGGIVDFLEEPDLQLENGLLRWKVPLYPHMFLGTCFTLSLDDVPPGKYRLYGRYVVGRPQHEETDLERALIASRFSIFQGVVETNSIYIEVLPKKQALRKE